MKSILENNNDSQFVWKYDFLKKIYIFMNYIGLEFKNKRIKIITIATIQLSIYISTQNYFLYFFAGMIFLLLNNTKIIQKLDSLINKILNDKNEKYEVNNNKKFLKLAKKLSKIAVDYTDSFLIYIILGHHMSGIYSNYDIILSGFADVFNSIYEVIFDICNYFLKKFKISNLAKAYNLILMSSVVYFIVGKILYKYLNRFIKGWIGHKEMLGRHIIIILVLDLCFTGVLFSVKKSKRSLGILKKNRENYLMTLGFIIITSMIFGEVYGIMGILAGGMLGRVIIKLVMEISEFLRVSSIYKAEGKLFIINSLSFLLSDFQVFIKYL